MKPLAWQFRLDRLERPRWPRAQAAAQRLRQGEDVRLDAEMLEGEIAAEPPEGGLRLVEDSAALPRRSQCCPDLLPNSRPAAR